MGSISHNLLFGFLLNYLLIQIATLRSLSTILSLRIWLWSCLILRNHLPRRLGRKDLCLVAIMQFSCDSMVTIGAIMVKVGKPSRHDGKADQTNANQAA